MRPGLELAKGGTAAVAVESSSSGGGGGWVESLAAHKTPEEIKAELEAKVTVEKLNFYTEISCFVYILPSI